MRGSPDEVVARIDEEAALFQARLQSDEARAAFEAFLTRKKALRRHVAQGQDAVHHRRLARHRARDRAASRARRRQYRHRRQDRRRRIPSSKAPSTPPRRQIEKAGGQALPLVVDVRDEAAVKAAIDKTAATLRRHRHRGQQRQRHPAARRSPQTDMKRFDLMHQINTRGTFMVSKYAIPHLEKAANPHILMLSPPLDMKEKWFAPHTAYSMAKFGMSLVVLGLAGELRGKDRRQRAVAAHHHRHRRDQEPARRRRGDAHVAHAGDLADAAYAIFQKPEKLHRQFPDRRHVPRRRRRHRFRPLPRRSERAAAGRFLRARRACRRRTGVSLKAKAERAASRAALAPALERHVNVHAPDHPSRLPRPPHAAPAIPSGRTGCAPSSRRSRTSASSRWRASRRRRRRSRPSRSCHPMEYVEAIRDASPARGHGAARRRHLDVARQLRGGAARASAAPCARSTR